MKRLRLIRNIFFFCLVNGTLAAQPSIGLAQSGSQSVNQSIETIEEYFAEAVLLSKEIYNEYRDYIVVSNAPYAGLTLAPGGSLENNFLWKDASFGIGALMMDFKEPNNREVSGFLFDRPVYIGWDFKLFGQFHLCTGTTLLERHRRHERSRLYLFNSFVSMKARFNLCPKKY